MSSSNASGLPLLTSECQPLVPCQTRPALHGPSAEMDRPKGGPAVRRPSPIESEQTCRRFMPPATESVRPVLGPGPNSFLGLMIGDEDPANEPRVRAGPDCPKSTAVGVKRNSFRSPAFRAKRKEYRFTAHGDGDPAKCCNGMQTSVAIGGCRLGGGGKDRTEPDRPFHTPISHPAPGVVSTENSRVSQFYVAQLVMWCRRRRPPVPSHAARMEHHIIDRVTARQGRR